MNKYSIDIIELQLNTSIPYSCFESTIVLTCHANPMDLVEQFSTDARWIKQREIAI